MKFTGRLATMRIDVEAYKERLRKELGKELARCTQAWLGTATKIVPTWSGASQGTFLKLAAVVGFPMAISASPTSINSSSGPGSGLGASVGKISTEKFDEGKFFFTYSTSLAHLIYNEFNNANLSPDPGLRSKLINPGPYHFQEAARKAFEAAATSVRLPSPFDDMKVKLITV